MSNVKKAFQPLVDLLTNNSDKVVEDLMPEIYKLVLSTQMTSTCRRDDEGNVTHIFCYYHKKWEDISEVEYGTKASSTTGLNTMCKEGLAHWNKQNRDYKKNKSLILDRIVEGTLSPSEVESELEKLEIEKVKIVPRKDNLGSDE